MPILQGLAKIWREIKRPFRKLLRRRVRNVLMGEGAYQISTPIHASALISSSYKIQSPTQESSVEDEFVHMYGIIDYAEGFKRYFLSTNMPEKIATLKRGLDKKSQNNIDIYLERMLMIPDARYYNCFKISKAFIEAIYTPEEKQWQRDFADHLAQYKKEFYLEGEGYYGPTTFLFHNGLSLTSEKLKAYIAQGDFIDGGAFVGDSSILFARYYNPRRIYAFEISENNRKGFLKIMEANGVSTDKYELVPLGLSDTHKTIYINDTGHHGTTTLWTGDTRVDLIDLDSYVQEKKLNVKYIKTDLEGAGYDALKGMLETIKKDRPVLSLAIYHTPQEFFEMKPLLEKTVRDLNYKITIQRFSPFLQYLAEIMIFAYPKELEN